MDSECKGSSQFLQSALKEIRVPPTTENRELGAENRFSVLPFIIPLLPKW